MARSPPPVCRCLEYRVSSVTSACLTLKHGCEIYSYLKLLNACYPHALLDRRRLDCPVPSRALAAQQRRARRLIADADDVGGEQRHDTGRISVVCRALLLTSALLDCPAAASVAISLAALSRHLRPAYALVAKTNARSRGARDGTSTSRFVP